MKLMQCKNIVAALFVLGVSAAQAAEPSCFDDQPIGAVVVTLGAETHGSSTSAYFPVYGGAGNLTQAAVTVRWEVRDGMVRFTPQFHYVLPGEVGLAYNFYQLLWTGNDSAGVTRMVRHDLTRGCTAPGASIFPNQTWNASEYSFSARYVPGEMVVFLVWGGLG
jgi:hypothetical protein